MSQAHSASIIEILSVEAQDGKSKAGKDYTAFTCPSVIHCDTGETKVGNVKMFRHAGNSADFKTPLPGRYFPVYEPRPSWSTGECLPELIALVPVLAPQSHQSPTSRPEKPAVSTPVKE